MLGAVVQSCSIHTGGASCGVHDAAVLLQLQLPASFLWAVCQACSLSCVIMVITQSHGETAVCSILLLCRPHIDIQTVGSACQGACVLCSADTPNVQHKQVQQSSKRQ